MKTTKWDVFWDTVYVKPLSGVGQNSAGRSYKLQVVIISTRYTTADIVLEIGSTSV